MLINTELSCSSGDQIAEDKIFYVRNYRIDGIKATIQTTSNVIPLYMH